MDFNPLDYINFIPDKYRDSIVSVLLAGYVVLIILRRFTPPSTRVGQIVRSILSGWRHPEELKRYMDKKEEPSSTAVKVGVLLFGLSLAGPTFAEEPKFGGCLKNHPDICFQPAVSVNLVAMSLYNGDLTSTFDPGIGYGGTVASSQWYRSGFSVTATFPEYDGRRRLMPAGVFSIAEYFRIGLACPLFVPGGFQRNAQFLLGFGADFGRW